mmetsp:Transcript_3951/g.11447  ORF Transcript_3951/g.11447 Transcript_3951/m.11447 type:complete len:441 (+) Transcript_3951:91-1413(+)
MGQCIASERVPCMRGRQETEKAALRRASVEGGEALGPGLKAFRDTAMAASRAAGLDAEQPLAAACHLVESILMGVHAHLPNAIVDVDLGAGPPGALASISVAFAGGPLVGEIATRSRQPIELRLQQRVSFSIRRPEGIDFGRQPLLLEVSGLEQHVLPEIAELRRRLQVELVDVPDGWHPRNTGTWWLKRRETDFSLETSKLRRVCDSFTEVASLPAYFQGMAFWGYLHVTSRRYEAFEFYVQGGEVSVTARTHLMCPGDEAISEVGRALCRDLLTVYRPLAEHFAASTVNMGALFEGHALGQKGANPAKIAKLFSAARRWGPGEDGWHQLDETWLCVDKKDCLGRVVEEQGRMLWHAPGAPRVGDGRAAPERAPSAMCAPKHGSLVSVRAGCSSFALLTMSLFLLLLSVGPVAASAEALASAASLPAFFEFSIASFIGS